MRRAFSKPVDDASFDVLMNTYRDYGYEGLQLKMGQYVPWLDDVDGYLKKWGADTGRVSALIYFDTLDEEGASKLAATIRFAAEVGSERVVFCHNHPREGVTDADLTGFAHSISRFGADAAALGVALSLHHHFEQPVMHPHDFEVFFDAIEPGTVGLTIDTAHLAKSGIDDIPEFITRFAPLIDNIHLKDYENGEWRLFGQGTLDLDGTLDALTAAGYDGWLCADEESSADLITGLTVSQTWLNEYL